MTGFIAPMQAGKGLTIDWNNFNINNEGVLTFGGSNGDITLDNGLSVTSGLLALVLDTGLSVSSAGIKNEGVLTFGGSNGDITLDNGLSVTSGLLALVLDTGLSVSSAGIKNEGVLSLGGAAGVITLDNGLSISSGLISIVIDSGLSVSSAGIKNTSPLSDLTVGDSIDLTGNNLTLIADSGISIGSTGIKNTSPLSDLTVGSAIDLTGNNLTLIADAGISIGSTGIKNTGVLSFQGSTGDITLAEGTGISIVGTEIDVLIDNNTNIFDNSGNITVNENFQFVWNSQHIFNGSFTSLNDIVLETSQVATSTQNYPSPSIEFTNSYWDSGAPSGTLNSGNIVSGDNGGTAKVYIDGVLTASTTSSVSFSMPSGSHTLKVVFSHNTTTTKSLTQDFSAGTQTLTKHNIRSGIYPNYTYTGWATANYTGVAGSPTSLSESIYLNKNNKLVLGNFLSQSNTWTGEQTFSGGITIPYNSGVPAGASSLQIGATADFNTNTQQFGIALPAGATKWPFQIFAGGGTGAYKQFYVSVDSVVGTKNNILDNGSGGVSIAGNISAKHDFVTADYAASHTATDWIGTATLGAKNTLGINTGKTTLVFYNYYGGATPSTSGTVHWNHGNDDSGMALVESGATFVSTANCTYFWIAL